MELTKQEPEVIDVVEVEKVELILNERVHLYIYHTKYSLPYLNNRRRRL